MYYFFVAKYTLVNYFVIKGNGKTVKSRCGPAAVTDDENRDYATIAYDGKARQVG